MFYVKKIHVLNIAIYSFIIAFIISLIFCLPLMGMLNFFFNSMLPNSPDFPDFPFTFFKFFVFVAPFFYGIMAAIINAIIAFLYNLLSHKFNGIKIDLIKVE